MLIGCHGNHLKDVIAYGATSIVDRSNFFMVKQVLLALFLDMFGLIAGAIASNLTLFTRLAPWNLLAYPAILSVRGAINGMLCGRLSTSLHVGSVLPRIRRNTAYFYELLSSAFVLSTLMGLILGLLTFSLSLLSGIPIPLSVASIPTVIVTMGFSSMMSIFITSSIAVQAFKRGLDPDIILYPVMSTLADILVTACYVLSLSFLGIPHVGEILLMALFLFLLSISFFLFLRLYRNSSSFRDIIKELWLSLLILMPIEGIAGFALNSIRYRLEVYPGLMVIYPALIDSAGDMGSIAGSRTTTKLALGSLLPTISSIRSLVKEFSLIVLSTLPFYLALSFIAAIYSASFNRTLILSPLLSGLTVVPLIICFAFVIAILAFKRGLNPDNFVNPLEACTADVMMTSVLALLVFTFGS